MMSSSLSAPYFVLIAQQASSEGSLENLGMFIVISGVASFLSSSVWGRFADQSSRKVLLLTSLLTMILCLAAAGLRQFSFDYAVVWAMVLFFCLSITHQGVRLGRKTYVVDLDDGNARTHYVSTSNSVIGALLLVTGVFGAIAAQFSITWVLILFAVMALMALILGWSLPEATQE
jgi:MFS family permease